MIKTERNSLIFVFMLAVLLTSCQTNGSGSLKNAKEALNDNKPSQALLFATEALLKNPNYTGAKKFLRDNSDDLLGKINGFLDTTNGTENLEELELRFDYYKDLVEFYINLEAISLPIAEGKKLFGLIKSWEWSTEIIDYSQELLDSREVATSTFYIKGTESLDNRYVEEAYDRYKKVIFKFQTGFPDKQQEYTDYAVMDFINFGHKQSGSLDVEELLQGIMSFEFAIELQRNNTEAASGLNTLKLELAEVYFSQGMTMENQGTLETLKQAHTLYESALQYNPEHSGAQEAIPRVRTSIAEALCNYGLNLEKNRTIENYLEAHKYYEAALTWDSEYFKAEELTENVTENIAEYYYQAGKKQALNLKDDAALQSALDYFTKASEWIDEYKDTTLMKRRVYAARQVIILSQNLEKTQGEFNQTHARIAGLNTATATANKGMEDLFYVSDSIIELDKQMNTLYVVMGPMSNIPIVGVIFTITGTAVKRSHGPVEKASDKIKIIQKPLIEPVRNVMSSVNENVTLINNKMNAVGSALAKTREISNNLNTCLLKVEDEMAIEAVEDSVKELNKAILELNGVLVEINRAQDQVEGTLNDIAGGISSISRVASGLKKVMKPLSKISSVTNEIDKVLRKKVLGVSVKKALDKASIFKKAAEKLLNPVLNKLKIDVPTVPGLDELDGIFGKLEGYKAELNKADAIIRPIAEKIDSLPDMFNYEIENILMQTGCSF